MGSFQAHLIVTAKTLQIHPAAFKVVLSCSSFISSYGQPHESLRNRGRPGSNQSGSPCQGTDGEEAEVGVS